MLWTEVDKKFTQNEQKFYENYVTNQEKCKLVKKKTVFVGSL